MKRQLSIDLETFCEVDIKSAGTYKYAEKAEIILFAYSFDGEEPICIDVAQGERIPDHVIYALTDPEVVKNADNAPFEIAVIENELMRDLDVGEWRCSALQACV